MNILIDLLTMVFLISIKHINNADPIFPDFSLDFNSHIDRCIKYLIINVLKCLQSVLVLLLVVIVVVVVGGGDGGGGGSGGGGGIRCPQENYSKYLRMFNCDVQELPACLLMYFI